MKQHEAVIKAMKQHGGYATFGQLYQTTMQIPGCEWGGTKNPFANIRRIVQVRPEFFRIRPGLWGLTEQKDSILDKLALKPTASPAKAEEFNHTYYQGLLVEIGNLRHLETFVPNQDKNHKYLDKPLGEVSTVKKLYEFTYAHLLQYARTVDVTWFNDRHMPHSFFEVEHSTDIYNSLLKFIELQDFNARFWIAADQARQKEFKDKLALSAFKEIALRVKFISYDEISTLHSKEHELSLVGQKL